MIEAFEPLRRVRKVRAPLANAEANEKNGRQEQEKLELRTRVIHRAQAATASRALLECQFGYVGVYPLRFMRDAVGPAVLGCAGVAFARIVQAVHRSSVAPWDRVSVHGQREGGEWWPSCSWTYLRDSPPSIRRLAKVCRRV
jgi:hypothetical protein